MQPIVANKLQGSTGDAGHEATALGVGSGVGFLNPNDVNLEDIGGGDDEVRDRTNALTARPIGVEVVGRKRRDELRSEIGNGVSEVAGSAVFDACRPVHHLVRRVTHR